MKKYIKKESQLMEPWTESMDMSKVSVSEADKENGSPKQGDMIAVNSNDPTDKWLISEKFFKSNYKPLEESKTVDNTSVEDAKKKVSDIKVFGNGYLFQLISKASSKQQGWMKSTKAMQMPNGCVVQVTTQQGDNVAEALTFVPGVRIRIDNKGNKYLGI